MRARTGDCENSKIVKRFLAWAEKTRSALYKEKTVPASSLFVLISFVDTLCCIHRNRTVSDETGESVSCENHHYLYIALRMTYDFHGKSKVKVSMLLREIFFCEGSLQAIFSMPYPSTTRPTRLWPTHVNINTYTLYSKPAHFDRSALEYFVKCICPVGRDVREREDLVYSPIYVLNQPIDTGVKLTTPLLAATMFGDPALVLLLLRYGADPLLCPGGDESETRQKSPVGFVVDELNICVLLGDCLQGAPTPLTHRTRWALTCLQLFTRAALHLDIRESSGMVDTTGAGHGDPGSAPAPAPRAGHGDTGSAPGNRAGHGDTGSAPHPRAGHGDAGNVPAPRAGHGDPVFRVQPRVGRLLDLTSLRQLPSLRHACRHVIRRVIMAVSKEPLPTAIKGLPLPVPVRRYLDLRV